MPLGAALVAAGDAAGAEEVLRQVLSSAPTLAPAQTHLGNALAAQGRWTEALEAQRQAVILDPDNAQMRADLAHALKTVGDAEAALQQLERALALEPQLPQRTSEALFVAQYRAGGDGPESAARALARARDFGALVAGAARPRRHSPPALHARPRRLRVGFVSPDLRAHPVGAFTESVFAALAAGHADRVALHVYATHHEDDNVTARLRRHCTAWSNVAALDDAALAARIGVDAIDALVDLAGHTRGSRLPMFAWRPAPVQVSWLGWCATTGLETIDACIVDPWIAPPGAEAAYVERLERLPETFLCFTPPQPPIAVGTLPSLTGRGLRFACFNQLAKIGDAVVTVFARVLHAVPDSRLAFRAGALQDAAVRNAMAQRFAAHGIAAERLELLPAVPRSAYLADYAAVDIGLDPFPYPGGTTTLEALWMGVPVLTLPGATALSRRAKAFCARSGWTTGSPPTSTTTSPAPCVMPATASDWPHCAINCGPACWPHRCATPRASPATSSSACVGCGGAGATAPPDNGAAEKHRGLRDPRPRNPRPYHGPPCGGPVTGRRMAGPVGSSYSTSSTPRRVRWLTAMPHPAPPAPPSSPARRRRRP